MSVTVTSEKNTSCMFNLPRYSPAILQQKQRELRNQPGTGDEMGQDFIREVYISTERSSRLCAKHHYLPRKSVSRETEESD